MSDSPVASIIREALAADPMAANALDALRSRGYAVLLGLDRTAVACYAPVPSARETVGTLEAVAVEFWDRVDAVRTATLSPPAPHTGWVATRPDRGTQADHDAVTAMVLARAGYNVALARGIDLQVYEAVGREWRTARIFRGAVERVASRVRIMRPTLAEQARIRQSRPPVDDAALDAFKVAPDRPFDTPPTTCHPAGTPVGRRQARTGM